LTERHALIASKLPLVGRAVRRFLRANESFGFLRDDLRSAAEHQLIRSIDAGVRDDSHQVIKMLAAIKDAADKEAHTVRVPGRTRRRHNIKPIPCKSLTHDRVDPRSGGDPLRPILESTENDRERQTIEMRAAGYTNREIADKLGCHPSRISQIVKAVEARYFNGTASDTPHERPKRGNGVACRCGQPIETKFDANGRCSDCWADDQQHYHGRCQRANIVGLPTGEPRYREESPYATAC